MSRGPARFEVWNAANDTKLATLNQVGESAKIDDASGTDVGLLTVTVGLDEDAAEFCVEGNHVRAYLADRIMFTGLIEDGVQSVMVAVQPADQVINLSLRGHAALFSQVPIAPYGGLDFKPQSVDRPHMWASPETDISTWDDPVVLFDQLAEVYDDPTTHFDPPWYQPWYPPRGMSDLSAQWLTSSTPDPVDGHPVGESLFACDVTISDDGLYEFQVAADDKPTFFLDGILAGEGKPAPADSFIDAWVGCFELTAGTHRIGILVENFDRPVIAKVGTFGGPNILRMAFAMYYRPDGVNTVLSDDLVVRRSDGTGWKCLDFPETFPAPTDGAILRIHIADEGEGAFDDVTLGFTDTLDSNGNAWVDNGAMTLQVDDDDNLTMLQTMSNSGRIDWRFDLESRTLYAYNFGTMGATDATNYTVGNGLLGLTETTLPRVGSLRVRHKTGRFLIGTGFPRKALTLADLSEPDARVQAQRQYDAMSTATSSRVVALELGPWEDAAGFPYATAGWRVGDSPSFASDEDRVKKLSTAIDAAGWPTFVPEVQNRYQTARERQEIQLGKVTGGTLNGRSRAATPVEGLTRGVTAGFARKVDTLSFPKIQLTTPGYEAAFSVSPSRKWEENLVRVHRLDIRQTITPQDVDTICEVHVTGPAGDNVVATLTLPVGGYHRVSIPDYLHVGILDSVYVVTTQEDTPVDTGDPEADTVANARWLIVDVYATDANPAVVEPAQVDVPW